MKNFSLLFFAAFFSVIINHLQFNHPYLLKQLFKQLDLNETYFGFAWYYYCFTFFIAFLFFTIIFIIIKRFQFQIAKTVLFTLFIFLLAGIILGLSLYSPKIDDFYLKFYGSWFYFFILPNIPGFILLHFLKLSH